MTAPRKQTSLLAWLPAQGTPGQRHANRALVTAFARFAASPEARTGRVRDALARIAADAQAAYAARTGEADAPAKAPKARKAAKAAKAAPKAKAAKAKSTPNTRTYTCEDCARPVIATMREFHEKSASHKRNASA